MQDTERKIIVFHCLTKFFPTPNLSAPKSKQKAPEYEYYQNFREFPFLLPEIPEFLKSMMQFENEKS